MEPVINQEPKTVSTQEEIVNLPYFTRPGTATNRFKINFMVGNGGIGDLICYLQALKYTEIHWPHLIKTCYTFKFFEETARLYLNDTWEFKEAISNGPTDLGPVQIPTAMVDTKARINLAGTHPLDLGFLFFNNMMPPEGWNHYPQLKLSGIENKAKGIGRYAVMTPGALVGVRQMLPVTFNAIVKHLISVGLTPVFLGNSEIAKNYGAQFSTEYTYDGLDLRNKTTINEAVKVMSEAEMVIGIDNGLLHLAGATNVDIIFGYTVAAPEHRRPRRPKGSGARCIDITPDISCKFCQSRVRFINRDFVGKCLYDDNACLNTLTAEKFIIAIELLRKNKK